MKPTGLLDKNGVEIKAGDFVSLAGNMTTDDSLGTAGRGTISTSSECNKLDILDAQYLNI